MAHAMIFMFGFTPPGNSGGFLFHVRGFAKSIYTGKGGGCVDIDGNPLLFIFIWQKAPIIAFVGEECLRLPPNCLRHQKVQNAAFCH
jgi:hypothetical protein